MPARVRSSAALAERRFVAGATDADGFVVSARMADGLHLVWVEKGTPGATLSFEALADGSFGATLTLDQSLAFDHVTDGAYRGEVEIV